MKPPVNTFQRVCLIGMIVLGLLPLGSDRTELSGRIIYALTLSFVPIYILWSDARQRRQKASNERK